MRVSRTEVSSMLGAIIDGRLPRESAEAWAQRRARALDAGELVFEPAEQERSLWEAIDFLQCVGMKQEEGGFVISRRDLEDFRSRYRL